MTLEASYPFSFLSFSLCARTNVLFTEAFHLLERNNTSVVVLIIQHIIYNFFFSAVPFKRY